MGFTFHRGFTIGTKKGKPIIVDWPESRGNFYDYSGPCWPSMKAAKAECDRLLALHGEPNRT